MIVWRLFLLNVLVWVESNPIIEGEGDESRQIVKALNAVLGARPQHRDFVLLLNTERSLFKDVGEVRAPWGIGVFEVKVDDQDNNVTQAHLSLVGEQARQLRTASWSVTVVVVSDDPAFLATFAEWSLKGRLLVWSTRLLVLTRLPFHRLHHLRNTLVMTNSMLIQVTKTNNIRIKVYIDLPYSLPGGKMLSIASWSPESGLRKDLQIPYYPDKFSKFSNGARLSVSRVMRGFDRTMTVDDPGAPGEKKILVFNADNALLEAIADNMNFTIKYISPPDGHWGTLLPDGSWTGMVGMVLRHESDIGLGLFTITPTRHEAVDFTYPVSIGFMSFLGGRGSPEVDPWSFLLPLTPLVWVILLVVLLGVVAVTILLLYCSPLQQSILLMLQDSSATYIRVLLQQDVFESEGWWWWQRLVVGVWMLMTLVLTRSYAGNLMSQLAVRYIPEPLHTLEDFLDTKNTLILNRGGSTEQAFKTATSGVYQDVWDVNKLGRIRFVMFHEQDKILQALREGDSYISIIFATDSMQIMSLQFSMTGKCEFYIGRGQYLTSLDSLAVAKGSPLLPVLSRKVMQVSEAGLYWYWFRLYFRNLTSCLNAPRKFAIKSPLAIRNLWGMFVVLAGGGMASVLVFFMELISFRVITINTE